MVKKRSLRKQTRGLSTIIANLLLILLVIIAIGIVWVVIRNILATGAQNVNISQLTLTLGIKSAYISGSSIYVTVHRNAGAGDLTGIRFVFASKTQSVSSDRISAMQQLDQLTFVFNSSEVLGIVAGDTVSVAPIYTSSGTQKISNPTDTLTISGTQPVGGTGGTVCGDGICQTSENPDNCPQDCPIIGGGGNNGTGNPLCGNGMIDSGEQCDAGNQNGIAGSGCSSTCTTVQSPACNNNGVVDSGELCDGTDLNGKTCTSLGYSGGTLSCDANCNFDTAQCIVPVSPVCGNGIVEGSEACDLGSQNGVPGSGCSSNCQIVIPPSCDGTWNQTDINAGNQCDGTPLPHGCTIGCMCTTGFHPDGNGGCQLYAPLNSGIISSAWNNIFFDSENLPKDSGVANYIADYVNFSNSPETKCFQINFASYLSQNNISYLRVSESNGSLPNIAPSQTYSVWNATNCGYLA